MDGKLNYEVKSFGSSPISAYIVNDIAIPIGVILGLTPVATFNNMV